MERSPKNNYDIVTLIDLGMETHWMKCTAILGLLVLASSAVGAEWTHVDDPVAGVSVYIDRDSIREAPAPLRQFQLLMHYQKPFVMFGLSYQSVVASVTFDCAQKTRHQITAVAFSGPMGSGNVVQSEADSPSDVATPIGSEEVRIFKAVCGG